MNRFLSVRLCDQIRSDSWLQIAPGKLTPLPYHLVGEYLCEDDYDAQYYGLMLDVMLKTSSVLVRLLFCCEPTFFLSGAMRIVTKFQWLTGRYLWLEV